MCVAMLTITTLTYAQLPKSPDGKDLYQKGDCKTILINVKYKCVFCEDEALTKNCKEYDCTLTECTESKHAKATGGKQRFFNSQRHYQSFQNQKSNKWHNSNI